MISGFITFSSKLPSAPPKLIATSLPMTCEATIVMASLWVGLTLPGMIELPGSFSGMRISPSPLRGPDAIQRTSLAIFISDAARVLIAPCANSSGVVTRQRLELVGRGDELVTGQPGQLVGDADGVLGMRVEPGADGGAPECQLAQVRQRLLDVPQAVVEQLDPAGDLLAEGQGGCVHQVRAADLDDRIEGFGLVRERLSQLFHRRDQPGFHGLDGRDVHRRGEDVVGRLAHVDVVVRVDLALHPALAAHQLAGAVGDHLVDVHVRLGAAARLPDDQRELAVVLTGDHLVGRRDDRLRRSPGP